MSKVKSQLSKVKRGFSMLEAILAVFVLSTGIVGVMSLFVSSMRHSMDSRDTIIATELAQEGLELVRYIRDNNVASGNAGGSFNCFSQCLPSGCWVGSGYTYGAATCFNSNPGAYNYRVGIISSGFYASANNSGATLTKFSRKIFITDDTNGKKITSVVTWDGNDNPENNLANCTLANKCTAAQAILMAR